MARVFVTASNQYLEAVASIVGGAPLTMGCWFKAVNATADHGLVGLGSNGTSDCIVLYAYGTGAGDPIRFYIADTGAGHGAVTTTGFTAGQWHLAVGVMAASNDWYVTIDAGSKGSSAIDKTPGTLDRVNVGAIRYNGSLYWYANASVVEPFLYDCSLTDEEVWQIYKGVPPWRIRPGNLVMYAPLRYGRTWDRDIRRGLVLTPYNGPTWGPDPQKVIKYWRDWELPKWRRLAYVAGAPPVTVDRWLALLGVGE